jgi:hypothetical protein
MYLECGGFEMKVYGKMAWNYAHSWYQCQLPGFDTVLNYVKGNHWDNWVKGKYTSLYFLNFLWLVKLF